MKRLLLVTSVGLLGLAGAPGCADDPGPDAGEEVALPASAIDQIDQLLAEKEARTPAQRKIASQLLYQQSGRFPLLGRGEDAVTSLTEVDATGRVLVDIHGDVDGGLVAKVEAAGGSVVERSAAHGSVRAWMDLPRIEELAAADVVGTIRPALAVMTNRRDPILGGAKFVAPSRAERIAQVQALAGLRGTIAAPIEAPVVDASGYTVVPNVGAATSQGSKAHGVDRARKWFNTTGAGVKVGVISDSDDLKEASIASGDLPADTFTLPGQSGRPGTGEGTAMMEIVADVAPGAKLFFATGVGTAQSFADNIRALRFTYHCDIIVDDLTVIGESPYADDIVAAAVMDVTADGALYYSSAGNAGNFDDGTSGTWEGDFKAATGVNGTLAALPSGYTVHDFGGITNKVIANRVELSGGPLFLNWSDPSNLDSPVSTNDYDLFLLDQDLRNVIVASTDVQAGAGLPFEYLGYAIPANYRVVIAARPGAAKRALRLEVLNGELGIGTAGGVFGHNSAPGGLAIAAVDVAEVGPAGEFVAGPTTPVELYSTDGTRRVFYDRNNVPINGGVLMASGGETRKKPDLTGADGVLTTLPSPLSPFFGTSAAGPHVAGIAALVKSAVPAATPTKIMDSMRLGALDIEGTGVDRDAGSGIVSAMNSLTRAGAIKAAYLEINTITVTPTTSDAILPGGGGLLRVRLIDNGGAGATAINATLASTSPDVTITQASSNYPNVISGGTSLATTQYAFTVAPTALCGSRLPFTLTVNFNGVGTHPTVLAFTVQTGRTAATGTTVSYTGPAVAIPDGNLAGVNVPLTVAMSGPLAKLIFRIGGGSCTAAQGATTVGVDHSWASDLVFKLRSPSGKTVTLIDRAGGPSNDGNNFCQTVLDEAAVASIQAVVPTSAPFTGSFKPANPETVFIGDPAAGSWTLNVSDLVTTDFGNIRAFSIETRGFSCTP